MAETKVENETNYASDDLSITGRFVGDSNPSILDNIEETKNSFSTMFSPPFVHRISGVSTHDVMVFIDLDKIPNVDKRISNGNIYTALIPALIPTEAIYKSSLSNGISMKKPSADENKRMYEMGLNIQDAIMNFEKDSTKYLNVFDNIFDSEGNMRDLEFEKDLKARMDEINRLKLFGSNTLSCIQRRFDFYIDKNKTAAYRLAFSYYNTRKNNRPILIRDSYYKDVVVGIAIVLYDEETYENTMSMIAHEPGDIINRVKSFVSKYTDPMSRFEDALSFDKTRINLSSRFLCEVESTTKRKMFGLSQLSLYQSVQFDNVVSFMNKFVSFIKTDLIARMADSNDVKRLVTEYERIFADWIIDNNPNDPNSSYSKNGENFTPILAMGILRDGKLVEIRKMKVAKAKISFVRYESSTEDQFRFTMNEAEAKEYAEHYDCNPSLLTVEEVDSRVNAIIESETREYADTVNDTANSVWIIAGGIGFTGLALAGAIASAYISKKANVHESFTFDSSLINLEIGEMIFNSKSIRFDDKIKEIDILKGIEKASNIVRNFFKNSYNVMKSIGLKIVNQIGTIITCVVDNIKTFMETVNRKTINLKIVNDFFTATSGVLYTSLGTAAKSTAASNLVANGFTFGSSDLNVISTATNSSLALGSITSCAALACPPLAIVGCILSVAAIATVSTAFAYTFGGWGEMFSSIGDAIHNALL